MRDDPIKSFRTAFKGFLKEENLEQSYKQQKVIADWESLMGKTIASRTEKVFFSKKVLFIKLTSAPLRSEMLHAKEQILEIVRKEVGYSEIEDVRLL